MVDKATLGDDASNVELDWEELRTTNEHAEKSLEHLFEERQNRELALKSIENELLQVRTASL